MANDWIKMRGGLTEHPKVVAMVRILQCNGQFRDWITPGGGGPMNGQIVCDEALRCVTCALLLRVWSRAREHGEFQGKDLILSHNTLQDIDQMAGAPGFGLAMKHVGWAVENNGVTFPNFLEFNVPMTNSEKQREYRLRKEKQRYQGVTTQGNKTVTREEKRREEKNTKKTYKESVERLYQLYPRKAGTGKAKEAIEKALQIVSEEVLTEAVQAFAKSPAGNAGKFTPHPATWFNQRRWEDDRAEWNLRDDSRTGTGTNRVGPGQRYDPGSEPGDL